MIPIPIPLSIPVKVTITIRLNMMIIKKYAIPTVMTDLFKYMCVF